MYFSQVLEGLKQVTLISPGNVSFAEARRDVLIAIAKYVYYLDFFPLILSQSFLLFIVVSPAGL